MADQDSVDPVAPTDDLPVDPGAGGPSSSRATDSVWAFGVGWDLLMEGVDVRQVRDGLREALALVRETQESPQELFGTAADHASTLWDRWVSEGRLVLIDPNRSTFAEAVWLGLGLSTAYAVVLGIATWVRGDLASTTVSTVLLVALAIGMGSSLHHGLWSRRHSRPNPAGGCSRRPGLVAGADRDPPHPLRDVGPPGARHRRRGQRPCARDRQPVEVEFGTPRSGC